MTDRELAKELLNAEWQWLSSVSEMHSCIKKYERYGDIEWAAFAMDHQFEALYWRDEYFELVRKTTYTKAWSDYTDLLNFINGVGND